MARFDKDKKFRHNTYAMLRRLEDCVRWGTQMWKGDWELLFQYLVKVAANKGSATPVDVVEDALTEFFSPDGGRWNLSEGPIEFYFDRILDRVCGLQKAQAARPTLKNSDLGPTSIGA